MDSIMLVMGVSFSTVTWRSSPRIRTAGDLRAAQFQRIATGQGSGAEAVLAAYYATVPSGSVHVTGP